MNKHPATHNAKNWLKLFWKLKYILIGIGLLVGIFIIVSWLISVIQGFLIFEVRLFILPRTMEQVINISVLIFLFLIGVRFNIENKTIDKIFLNIIEILSVSYILSLIIYSFFVTFILPSWGHLVGTNVKFATIIEAKIGIEILKKIIVINIESRCKKRITPVADKNESEPPLPL